MGFEERYEIGGPANGVIGYRSTRQKALELATRWAERSMKVTVYDRMAHKGSPELWDPEGVPLSWK
ncbi:hypothetical protein LCGC14_1467410 [marine sediment metagenome]|uniref:Uncharacterized protein n=1 Tax=marine sediment metagenome TaxID=412755 RepID=A0A0F9JZD6_9ZZZZ